MIPALAPGPDVQRDDVSIRGRGIELVPVERESLHARFAAAFQSLRKGTDVAPENAAVDCVDRLDCIGALDEQDAIVDQGRRFVGTGGQRQCPGDTEMTDSVL